MMPGQHNIPPAVPIYPNGRRQHEYAYPYPPQGHPYAAYPPPPHFHPQPAPHYGQQWYPGYPPQPYSPVPRQFHPPPPVPPPQHPHGPVIVSSHMPPQAVPPMPRQSNPTPTPTTPSVPQTQTPPQPAPSTPSATSQVQESPATPTTSVSAPTPPPAGDSRASIPAPPTPVAKMVPWYPPLPWLSVPSEPFPPLRRQRRRKPKSVAHPDAALQLPAQPQAKEPTTGEGEPEQPVDSGEVTEEQTDSQSSTVAARSDLETPATSLAPSEVDSTVPATPPAAVPTSSSKPVTSPAHMRTPTKPVVPVVPITPKAAIPPKTQGVPPSKTDKKEDAATGPSGVSPPPSDSTQSSVTLKPESEAGDGANVQPTAPEDPVTTPPPPKPKSWAELLRPKPPPVLLATSHFSAEQSTNPNEHTKSGSLAEALRGFSLNSASRIPFLEPRGLVNTGNMCYMNSILQVLVFCIPFYDLLDQIGKRAAHSFKSETPLLDAMIMFMREFKVIDAAESVEKLRMRLKDTELEQYGDPFIPEYVYEVIRRLPRFAHMRRGHQQDAEEFLGFLLQGLHDECAQALLMVPSSPTANFVPSSPTSESSATGETGWHEVGPKQKASITRTSGDIAIDTPLTKIFGGKLRSELRVPGSKNSVTFEPYQPLQLDISSPDVHNITDALKGLTRSEILHGEFKSPRGPSATAKKQVFIETLPPVLILHLKRFQYDNTGGAQKIWKKIGYPLDLTIPKEVFPPHRQSQATLNGLPKYRLNAVVYHHGKSAAGGHYTVDVRRQDGREWVRLDDTVIRRLRVEDVAAGGVEEDPRVLAKALEQHKKDSAAGKASIFQQLEDGDEDKKSEGGEWNQVNGAAKEHKKWSAVANGSATPSTAGKRTPKIENVKDNKVAYILFYRRID